MHADDARLVSFIRLLERAGACTSWRSERHLDQRKYCRCAIDRANLQSSVTVRTDVGPIGCSANAPTAAPPDFCRVRAMAPIHDDRITLLPPACVPPAEVEWLRHRRQIGSNRTNDQLELPSGTF